MNHCPSTFCHSTISLQTEKIILILKNTDCLHSKLGSSLFQNWISLRYNSNKYVFMFSPKRDMHWLRDKEIKDSLNSQAVPKILVHKRMTLSGSTLAQVPLLSPILTCMTSFAELAFSNALRFPKNSGPKKIKDGLTLHAVLNTLMQSFSQQLLGRRSETFALAKKQEKISSGFELDCYQTKWHADIKGTTLVFTFFCGQELLEHYIIFLTLRVLVTTIDALGHFETG